MTATMSAQARLDQLNAEEADDKAKTQARAQEKARLALTIALDQLADTVRTMQDALAADNTEILQAEYAGSSAGRFWGPVNTIKKTISKVS